MKKIYLALLPILLCFATSSMAQQVNSTFFMENIPQSVKLNPAKQIDYKWAVTLPVINVQQSFHNQFNFDDIYYEENGQGYFDYQGLMGELKETNNLQSTFVTTELFGIYHQTENFGIHFSTNYHVLQNLNYDKNLFKVLFNGPSSDGILGVEQALRAKGEAVGYHSIDLGSNVRINDRLVVGATIKLLSGTHQMKMNLDGTFLQEDQANMPMTLGGDVNIQTNGTGDILNEDGEFEFTDEDQLTESFYSFQNLGVAFDFGATYKLTEQIMLEASVSNLGTIKWKEDQRYDYIAPLEEIHYSGIDPNDIFNDDIENSLPSVSDSLEFSPTTNGGSDKTVLPWTVNLGGSMEFARNASVGVLFSQMIYQKEYFPSLTVAVDKQFGQYLGLGLSYSMDKQDPASLGAMFSVGFPGFQFYMLTDNLLSTAMSWDKASSANIQFGLNFTFGYNDESAF